MRGKNSLEKYTFGAFFEFVIMSVKCEINEKFEQAETMPYRKLHVFKERK